MGNYHNFFWPLVMLRTEVMEAIKAKQFCVWSVKHIDEVIEIMKAHTTIGRDAIASAERSLAADVGFLGIAKEIASRGAERAV